MDYALGAALVDNSDGLGEQTLCKSKILVLDSFRIFFDCVFNSASDSIVFLSFFSSDENAFFSGFNISHYSNSFFALCYRHILSQFKNFGNNYCKLFDKFYNNNSMISIFDQCVRGILDEEVGFVAQKGDTITNFTKKGISVKRYTLSKDRKLSTKYFAGNYVICDGKESSQDNIIEVLSSEFKKMFCPSSKKVLCCGIGNPFAVADSLGPRTVYKLMREKKGKLCLFIPFVEGLTGISSFELIKSVIESQKIDKVILIDSLVGRRAERVGRSYQLTDSGIIPGSAVGSHQAVNSSSLGVDTFVIGVPMVLRVQNPTIDEPDLLLSPKEVDFLIENTSDVIAKVIIRTV